MQLTICVPTFNRADELDRQLAWLARETSGHGRSVEVVVSDNCSADQTAEVVARWSGQFGDVPFRAQRHPQNIGWMRNFVSCYEAAAGRFCWIIGDDDKVADGTLAVVLGVIDRDPELALLYLNFYGRAADTGGIVGEHWFDPSLADLEPDAGREIFSKAIERHFGAVIFISSTIIRTDLALEGIGRWPECIDNWGGMAFWCAFGALHGHVHVTRETYVECTLGQSYWQKDPLAWFRIRHRDIPAVYRQMESIGYRRTFCARKIAKVLQEDVVGGQTGEHLREYVRAFARRPLWTMSVMASYASSLIAVVLSL